MKRRLYVETNFIIELVLEQDGHEACSAILERAGDDLEVFIPNVSLLEARSTFDRRLVEHRKQLEAVDALRGHLRRTALATRASELKMLANQLTADYFQDLEMRWAEVMRSLDAKLVSFPASFVSAIKDSESELKSPDFLIAQAILTHAAGDSVGTHEMGFLTHDKAMKDWAENQFKGWACFSSFEAARGWALRSAPALP